MARNLLILAIISAVVLQGFQIADLAIITAVLFCAIAAGLIGGYGGGLVLRGRLMTAAVLALGVWLIVSAVSGVAPDLSILACYQMALLPLVFMAYFLCRDRERLWRDAVILFQVLCAGLASYALFEMLIGRYPAGKAFFVQPNSLSGYLLVIVFPLAAELSRRLRRRGPVGIRSVVLAGVIFTGFFTIPCSTSRAAIGALCLGMMLFYASLAETDRLRSGRLLIALALWGYLGANLMTQGTVQESMQTVVAASSAFRFGDFEMALDEAAESELSPFTMSKLNSVNQRVVLWKGTADLLPTTRWQGFGPGAFRLVYPRFSSVDDRTAHSYAHNDFLQFYIELGLPGVVLIGAIMLWVAVRFRVIRRSESPPGNGLEAIGVFTGLVAAAAHSFFSYNFYVAPTSMLIGLLLARYADLAAPPWDDWRFASRRYFRKPVFTGVVVLGIAVPVGLMMSAFAMSAYYELGARYLVAGDLTRAERHLNTAAVLYDTAKVQIARSQLYLAAFDVTRDETERTLFFDKARAGIESARFMNPHSPEVPFTLGLLAQRDPSLSQAERDRQTDAAFDEALEIDARFFPARLERARILYERNHKHEALLTLERGLRWPFYKNPAVFDYAEFTRDLRAELGDEDGAERMDADIRIMKNFWNQT